MTAPTADLSPDSPLSLDDAAKILLRGLVKASTLRAAASRGELEIERLGRRIVTTPAFVDAWRNRCREKQEDRTYSSGAARMALRSGISETVETASAQDATRAILKGLAQNSASISRDLRGQTSAHVIPLKSK